MAVQARQIALLLAAFSLIAVAVSGRRLLAAATPQCSRRPGRSPEQRAAQHARECSHQVHAYMKAHTADFEAEHDVKKLVFFLHVPRTAGKTYANCFLRTALPPSKRCAKSYDVLRYNLSAPGCLAIVSHDDFSAVDELPPDAAVITQLRRPVDRVVSAYEFAVDVAARQVHHGDGPPGKLSRRKADWVGTLEVWPWSVLVPWFRRDMKQRMERLKVAAKDDPSAWHDFRSPDNKTYWWNEAKKSSVWVLPSPEAVLDPYNNSLAMPLHEFVEHPIAEELLHNGGTLQVLGLTNYSRWQETKDLRACLRGNGVAREMLLALATRRLRFMAHVGLSERVDESVQSMAADLGLNLSGPAYQYTSANGFSYDTGAADDEALVTYNSTTAGGVNTTCTRREGMQRVNDILNELRDTRAELDQLMPRLWTLADQETKWLEEGGQQGAAAKGADVARDAATTAAVAAAAAASGGVGGSSSGAEASEGKEAEAAVDALGNVLDGNTEMVGDEESSPSSSEAAEGGEEPQQQREQQRKEQPQVQPPVPAEAEGQDGIDSPWAQEIAEVDGQVAAKQERMRLLEAELASLHGTELVVLADSAKGPARQLIPDEHFRILGDSLGHAYQRCANAGHTRNEKRKPYKRLRTPHGETFQFTGDARKRIPRALLDRIQALNALDEELWRAGEQILTEKLRAQRAAGLLQDFPPPPAEKPRPSKGLKRRLKSVPVAGPAPQPQQQKQQPVVQPVQARPAAVPVSLEARHEEL